MKRAFRNKIKEETIKNRELLIDDLSKVLQFEFNHLSLKEYATDKTIKISINELIQYLDEVFSKTCLYVLDYKKPYRGGSDVLLFQEEYVKDNNWNKYVDIVKEIFWNSIDSKEKEIFEQLTCFLPFEDRAPTNTREKALLLNVEDFNFLNHYEWLKFYDRLIEHFFPNYSLNKQLSNASKKRYLKNSNDGNLKLGLYYDRGRIKRELKMGYVLPLSLQIELYSEVPNAFIPIEDYLVFNEDSKIVQIDIQNKFGINNFSERVGGYYTDGEQLKKDLYLKAKVYSNYMKVYLNYINFMVKNL